MKILRKLKYLFLLILIAALAIGIWYLRNDEDETAAPPEDYVWNTTLEQEYIEFNGEKYIKNSKVETILLGGVDNDGKIDLSGGNGSGGQADVLLLLVINNETKTIDKIQIDRDTMTQFTVLNENYLAEGTQTAQIALSHAYGNGGSISCNNTVSAVENLLYGIDIDKYLFLNMGAIPTLNDFFGGVEVRIEDDFSAVDPTLVRWRRIKLNGTQAYNYIRARKEMNEPTNRNRLERIGNYMDGLTELIRTSISEGGVSAYTLYNELYDYMATSLAASEMTALVIETADYEMNETLIPEGTFNEESELEEFYMDDAALKQLVIDLFYIPYVQ
ncbi:MAG: LCP family protein [Clostridia bacterium]|nr:LCP family protein [Clostridia bacterium]